MNLTPHLAQFTSPTAAEFLSVVGSLVAIATIVSLYFSIMANRRRLLESTSPQRTILPSPLEIKNTNELATKKELEKVEEEIKEMFREQNKQSEFRIQKVHDRINTIAEEMPDKVIRLLRDTGHLRWPRKNDE